MTADVPITPAYYPVQISHHRQDPIEYGFSQRSSTWLVDLDSVPVLPHGFRWLANFRVSDHLGAASGSLRQAVDGVLARSGKDRPDQVLMLANPRVLGYVFNPLSVFYCLDAAGSVTSVIAEVRNTYGGRHDYLLETDQLGRAETDKVFYVSPFYPVDGEYTMRLQLPGEQQLVNVTMRRPGDRPFAAVMTGTRRNARSSLWRALRTPLATRAVMFGIKRHGIRLYTKGLRPFARPAQPPAAPADTATTATEPKRVLSS